MSTFRIMLADDHPVFRMGLSSLIRSHAGWEVCGEAADGREAVAKCGELKPDLLILDICMPKLNGVDAARFAADTYGKPVEKYSTRNLRVPK